MLKFNKKRISGHSDALSREIAERSATETLCHLSTAAEGMSSAELRGYVRAHSWPLICADLQYVAANDRLAESERTDLAARALEQTVHLVTRAYLATPVIAMPMPHITVRAAA